ncbi:MAG: hypothetical protein RXR51_06370 [Nitrososphaeria archaeon]
MSAKLTPLEFEVIDEHWNVFLLSDGTKLKEKHVLLSIARMDTYDALGRPIYQPFLFTFFVPLAPEELRGEPSNFVPSRVLLSKQERRQCVLKKLYTTSRIFTGLRMGRLRL